MPDSQKVTVFVRNIFEYTPEAVHELLRKYRRNCKFSSFVECRFDPVRQQFSLEGDSSQMEFAVRDFMDINQKMVIAETSKWEKFKYRKTKMPAKEKNKGSDDGSESSNSSFDPKEVPRIRKSKVAQLHNIPIAWSEHVEEEPKSKDNDWLLGKVSSRATTVKRQDDTVDYPVVDYWIPKVSKEAFSVMLCLTDDPSIPDELATLFGCALFSDWDKRHVKIGANDDLTLQRVYAKLNHVEAAFKIKFQHIIKHFLHVENKRKFSFRFVPLSKQMNKRRTTLFPRESDMWSRGSDRMFTVRLLEYRPEEEKWSNCVIDMELVDNAGNNARPREWTDYRYVHREPRLLTEYDVLDLDPLYDSDSMSQPSTAALDPEDLICEYHPPDTGTATTTAQDNITSTVSESGYGATSEFTTGTQSVPTKANRHVRARSTVPLSGTNDQPNMSESEASLVDNDRPKYQFKPSKTQRPPASTSSTNDSNDASSSAGSSTVDYQLQPTPFAVNFNGRSGIVAEESPPPLSRSTGRPKERMPSRDDHSEMDDNSSFRGLDTGLAAAVDFGERPGLMDADSGQPPVVASRTARKVKERKAAAEQPSERRTSTPPLKENIPFSTQQTGSGFMFDGDIGPIDFEPRPNSTAEASTEAVTPRSRTTRKLRERKAPTADTARTVTDFSETSEAVSEAETRRLRRTMHQKKPDARSLHDGKNDSDTLATKNLEELHRLHIAPFEYVRHYRGYLKFEAKIGRVIFADVPKSLQKMDQSGKSKNRSGIEWEEWEHIFRSPEINVQSFFTSSVTTEFFDAEFICDLKGKRSKAVFAPLHGENDRHVTYEFHCVHKNKPRILAIDAETFKATVFGEQEDFSVANIVVPLHMWDSSIVLTGMRGLDPGVEPYRSLVHSFSSTGKAKIPDITFLVQGEDFVVKSVFVKRELRYSIHPDVSLGVPMELSIMETQELNLQRHADIRQQYRAIGHDDRDVLKREARIQYMFSIIPTEVEQAMKENSVLEVGESARWKPNDILRLSDKLPPGAGRDKNERQGSAIDGLMNVFSFVISRIDNVGFANAGLDA